MSCVIQVTANGLLFTIFGVFEARVSIRHLPTDTYTTQGFVVKKKVSMCYCILRSLLFWVLILVLTVLIFSIKMNMRTFQILFFNTHI